MIKLKLVINGKEIELSADDIKALRRVLDALDGEVKERTIPVPYYVPCPYPTWPQYPPVWISSGGTSGYVSTGNTSTGATMTTGGTTGVYLWADSSGNIRYKMGEGEAKIG